MSYYPENKIREACRKVVMLTPAIEEQLMAALKKEDHVHDFADTDTVTVKELRESAHRVPVITGRNLADDLLKNISEHREPEYPYASVWQDINGIVWMRAMDDRDRVNMWMRMGREGKWGHDTPKRPLRRMDIIS